MRFKHPFANYLTLFLILMLSVSAAFTVSCSSTEADDETETEETEDDASEDEASEETDSNDSEKEESDADETENDNSNTEESHDKDEGKSHSKDDKSSASGSDAKPPKDNVTVTKLWTGLMDGNKRFVLGQHSNGQFVASRKSLIAGQKPEVIVISCSDSRVPPELVFDKNLGELFVIRTAGNVADPIALGSIEYAAEHLHAKMLIVLGHETCGAVAATMSGEKMPTANLRAITSSIGASFKGVNECGKDGKGGSKCVRLNVIHSAQHIVSRSPILKDKVADGSLHIVHAIYEMGSGKVIRF